MTFSIENSQLSPQTIIQKCIDFTANRPGLKKNNSKAKLRELAGREFDELIEALERPKMDDDQWIVEVAEEIPDVLIFILQHWLDEKKSHTQIAELLFQAESKASLLPHYTQKVYGSKMQELRPELAKKTSLDDSVSLRALTLCFALSHSLDFDLYELTDLKSDHNDKRYQPELYEEGCDYKESRKITKEYAKRVVPKEVHLYPQILELRRNRD